MAAKPQAPQADPEDPRVGLLVTEEGLGATHVSFEDGATYAVDPETGRVAGRFDAPPETETESPSGAGV